MASREFCQTVLQHLNQVAPVTARAMFGGYGIYANGVMFALIADDRLYFKVDENNRENFLALGMTPFTYEGKGKPVIMSYYQLPDSIWESPTLLLEWIETSAAIARRTRKKRK